MTRERWVVAAVLGVAVGGVFYGGGFVDGHRAARRDLAIEIMAKYRELVSLREEQFKIVGFDSSRWDFYLELVRLKAEVNRQPIGADDRLQLLYRIENMIREIEEGEMPLRIPPAKPPGGV